MRALLTAAFLLLSAVSSQSAAFLYDMSLIASDVSFKGRVQAAVYIYAVTVIASESPSTANHAQRLNYASMVLNNPGQFIPNFIWAAASNQTLANDVITAAGANFTSSTTAATVAAAITTATPATTGATETDINNAVAASWNVLAIAP